jgi:hypothetical protein
MENMFLLHINCAQIYDFRNDLRISNVQNYLYICVCVGGGGVCVYKTSLISISGFRDSLYGIATPYVLEGSDFEPRWGLDFPRPSRLVPSPMQPPVQGQQVTFPGLKLPGHGVDLPIPSKVENKCR